MRVTENTRIATLSLAQARTSSQLDKAARVAGNAQRVSKPSDDPVAYGAKVHFEYSIAMYNQHSENASRVLGDLDVAQNALSAGVDIMTRAQETAISGASSSLSADERKSLAEDVRTMRDELIALGNTSYGNRYLFSGTKTDVAPFDKTTGAFQGNDETIRVPVLPGVTPASNVSGATTFTSAGGRDIFADLASLATALDANDIDTIRTATSALTDGHAQLVRTQVAAGFTAERFRTAVDVLTQMTSSVTEASSSQIQGDPAAQLTDLSLAKNNYERTIAVTKQLLGLASS